MWYPAVIVAQLIVLAASGNEVASPGWSWNHLMLAPEFWGTKYAWNANKRVSKEEFEADLDVLRRRAEGGLLPACGLGSAGQEVCNMAKRGELNEHQVGELQTREAQAREVFSVGAVFEGLKKAGNWLSAALAGGKEKVKKQEAENANVEEDISKTEQKRRAAQEKAGKLQRELEEARRKEEEESRKAREKAEKLRRELEAARRRKEEEEERARVAEQQRRLFSARARGDPILCTFDQDGNEMNCVEYKGPAVVSCFEANGDLSYINFVGVCEKNGTNCQTLWAYWVGEHWQLDVKSLTWSYRDVRGNHTADLSCTRITSQAAPDARPEEKWLEPFNSGRSFMIHELQPTIMEGPAFTSVWRMISDPYLPRSVFDDTYVGEWTNAMLSVVGHAKRRGMTEQTMDIAMMSLAYGLASGAKQANFLPAPAKA